MIIVGSYSKEFYSDLKKANMPVVLVDTYQNPERFHEVKVDDRRGGYMATKYLIDRGHRDIAFISGALREQGVTQLRQAAIVGHWRRAASPTRNAWCSPVWSAFSPGLIARQRRSIRQAKSPPRCCGGYHRDGRDEAGAPARAQDSAGHFDHGL